MSALSASCDNNTRADRLRLKERLISVMDMWYRRDRLNVFPQSTVDNLVMHRNTLAILYL